METEKPVLVSQGLDNEIETLCNAESFLEASVESYPKGSCDYQLAKVQLRGVRERLAELGINGVEVVVYEDHDDGLGTITTKKEIKAGLKDSRRWLAEFEERQAKQNGQGKS